MKSGNSSLLRNSYHHTIHSGEEEEYGYNPLQLSTTHPQNYLLPKKLKYQISFFFCRKSVEFFLGLGKDRSDLMMSAVNFDWEQQNKMKLFPSGKHWQKGPGSCCHPKIASDLEADGLPSENPTLFALLNCVTLWKSNTIPLAPGSTGGEQPHVSPSRPQPCW